MNKIILFLILFLSISLRAENRYRLLDIRSGLTENRIREAMSMEDGRMAFATSSTIEVYDGSKFINFELSPEKAIPLSDYHGYRRLMEDSEGRLWLKNSGCVYVVDIRKGKLITDTKTLIGCSARLGNVFVSPQYGIWYIDDKGLLVNNGQHVVNLKINNIGVPEMIVPLDDRVYLCYETGRVCEIDTKTGAIVMNSSPFAPNVSDSLWAGMRAHFFDGCLLVSHNYRDYNRSGYITRLNIHTRQWEKNLIPGMRISDFCIHEDTLWIAGRNGLMRFDNKYRQLDYYDEVLLYGDNTSLILQAENITFDEYEGLWIGTLDNGVLYSNKVRNTQIETIFELYPFQLNGRFCSQRAERLAKDMAKGITNCSAEDNNGYVFLGTRKGLVVVDSEDRKVCTLDNQDGLPDDNVQAILVDMDGNIWLSTSSSIVSVRFVGTNRFLISNYNELDGVDIKGGEFMPERIHQDSTGVICVGFSSGYCRFSASMVEIPRYNFTYPRKVYAGGSEDGNSLLLLCCGVLLLLLAIGCSVYFIKRRYSKNQMLEIDSREQHKEYILQAASRVDISFSDDVDSNDKAFMEKLRKVVEDNVAVGDALTVQSLSELMAMDRTGLYRRMQQLTGLSPSVYIKEVRMSLAVRLLCETKLSVSDIAQRTGFSSLRYFNKVFKEKYSMSATEYRNTFGV